MESLVLLLYDVTEGVVFFTRRGGPVLQYGIVPMLVLMWTLILERVWYLAVVHNGYAKGLIAEWEMRKDHKSWSAEVIRESILSRGRAAIFSRSTVIQTCIVLCPLLGLLGTVTGMIEVFHVMAITGGGDARAMAGGVSRATLPTLSGMIGAVSGVFAMQVWLRSWMNSLYSKLDSALGE